MTAKVLDFKKKYQTLIYWVCSITVQGDCIAYRHPYGRLKQYSNYIYLRLSFCFAFRKESGKLMLNVEHHYYDWRPVFTSTVCSISL